MKLRSKLKYKVVNEIKELRESREDIHNFLMNFTGNVSRRYNFMHTLLNEYKDKKIEDIDVVKIATGLYINSLVTCWETYFRDIFVFICNKDINIQQNIKQFFKEKNIFESDLNKEGIDISEFMSKQFNFQDLHEICVALNFIFEEEKKDLSEYINEYVKEEAIFSHLNYILYWFQGNEDVGEKILETLNLAFSIRHKVTHDANFRMKIEPDFMRKLEDCFIIIPQFIAIRLSKKYNQKIMVCDVKKGYMRLTEKLSDVERPYIFTEENFTEKYEIVD